MGTAAAPGLSPGPIPAAAVPFSVGAVVRRSFSVYFGSFVPFALVTLAVNAPVLVLVALASESPLADSAARLLSAFAHLIVVGALTHGVLRGLKGAPAPLGALFSVGFSRLRRVLVTSLLLALLVGLGLALLVIPGFLALCAFSVSIPAVVVEPIAPSAALTRSGALTDGHLWQMLAVGAIVAAAMMGIAVASAVAVVLLASVLPQPLPALLGQVLAALAAPLGACASAVAYHDLRLEKDGVDPATLVKVFE